jgi:hypothetical protein
MESVTADQCQCRKDGLPCTYRPAQEDLLCDHCRAGCGVMIAAGHIPVHMCNTGALDVTARLQEAIDFGGDLRPARGRYAVTSVTP